MFSLLLGSQEEALSKFCSVNGRECEELLLYVYTCAHRWRIRRWGNIEETRHLSTETCPRQIKSSDENLNTNKNKEEGKQREPGSTADYDKAIGLIFCPSCCGSQEQLQWQGSIRSAIPLLHSLSRSIINDTERQKRSSRARCPAHAGATGGDGGATKRERTCCWLC